MKNKILQRSDGGGVFDVLDQMNGRTLCGCPTVTACQVIFSQIFNIWITALVVNMCLCAKGSLYEER